MKLLYSNLPPVRMEVPDSTFLPVFEDLVSRSDSIDIAVGYVSLASLARLRDLVKQNGLRNVKLIMGMYAHEGISTRTLKLAKSIREQWKKNGVGEILVVKPFKFHGKIYAFRKEERIFSVIIGSANLSAIERDSPSQRQYEVNTLSKDPKICEEINKFIDRLCNPRFSESVATCRLRTVIDENLALEGDENATPMASSDYQVFRKDVIGEEFLLPIKVPAEADKLKDDGKHFTQSNINVCYAKPRGKKPRDWYEIQFTVPIEVRRKPGYPKQGEPFFVATDDGYRFKVHTTSQNNKQFNAVGDELTLGRWLKGRFVSAGFIEPVKNTLEDKERKGMITAEMLEEFGCSHLALQKTSHFCTDKTDGSNLPLWTLGLKLVEKENP